MKVEIPSLSHHTLPCCCRGCCTLIHLKTLTASEIRAWNENKQHTQRHSHDPKYQRSDHCSGEKKFPHERFSNPRPAHPGVFTKSEIGGGDVDLVLVGDYEIAANGEREDELRGVSLAVSVEGRRLHIPRLECVVVDRSRSCRSHPRILPLSWLNR